MQTHPHELIWVAPEYEHREKTVSWYWITIILAILILTFAIWQKNYIFAVFIVIAEVLIIIWAGEEPRLVKFALRAKDLVINDRKGYHLKDIQHFSVEDMDHKEWADIVLHLKGPLHFPLKIHVPKHHLTDVRHLFQQGGVPEVNREESFIEVLEEFLGF